MKAKRVSGFEDIDRDKVCYYKINYSWMLFHPEVGLGSLTDHEVTEHEDGTITVSPSIAIETKHKGQQVKVHGYLEKGVWRDV